MQVTWEGFSGLDHWNGTIHPKSEPHFLVAAYTKGHEEGCFCFLPACPQSPWQLYLSYCWGAPSTGIRAYVFRILMLPEDQQLLGILQGSSTRLRPLRQPVSQMEQLPDSWPLYQGTAIFGILRTHLQATLINHLYIFTLCIYPCYQLCSCREPRLIQ